MAAGPSNVLPEDGNPALGLPGSSPNTSSANNPVRYPALGLPGMSRNTGSANDPGLGLPGTSGNTGPANGPALGPALGLPGSSRNTGFANNPVHYSALELPGMSPNTGPALGPALGLPGSSRNGGPALGLPGSSRNDGPALGLPGSSRNDGPALGLPGSSGAPWQAQHAPPQRTSQFGPRPALLLPGSPFSIANRTVPQMPQGAPPPPPKAAAPSLTGDPPPAPKVPAPPLTDTEKQQLPEMWSIMIQSFKMSKPQILIPRSTYNQMGPTGVRAALDRFATRLEEDTALIHDTEIDVYHIGAPRNLPTPSDRFKLRLQATYRPIGGSGPSTAPTPGRALPFMSASSQALPFMRAPSAVQHKKPGFPAPAQSPTKKTKKPTYRSPNSWILYRKHQHALLKPDYPDMSCADFSKMISGMWKEASEDVRKHFQRLAEKAKDENKETE